jgi:outer membrane lipoprotein SlyB
MKRLEILVRVAALCLATTSVAWAANGTTPAPTAPGVVQGVKLATLCANCAVVSDIHTETRKGKASGVGAVGGAVVGGVIGNKASDHGTLGTVGGAAIGGLLGNEIEKHAKKHTVWVTTVTLKDGSTKKYEAAADPGWKAGAVVEVGTDNQLRKH